MHILPSQTFLAELGAHRIIQSDERKTAYEGGFFLRHFDCTLQEIGMSAESLNIVTPPELSVEKTGPADDERVRRVRPLPTPEQVIRQRPILGTPVERLISTSRQSIRRI